ncbi:MAG TPA: hypothetical protein DCS07_06300 [Bdellovibrionales bacterium]|nr:hypothetical protein [Bdellovibrionales bacterium]
MTGLITREAFVKYLRETSAARTPNGVGQYAFNGAESPLVDPANPRLKFENPKKKSSKRKARSRARSSKKRR